MMKEKTASTNRKEISNHSSKAEAKAAVTPAERLRELADEIPAVAIVESIQVTPNGETECLQWAELQCSRYGIVQGKRKSACQVKKLWPSELMLGMRELNQKESPKND